MSNGLGRGLSSLIPKKINKVTTTAQGDAVVGVTGEVDKNKILQVSPDKIKTNPMQPRKDFAPESLEELVNSIKQYGVIQPLIVTQPSSAPADAEALAGKKATEGKYELIAGERRLRAAQIIGLDKVPVIVRDAEEQEKLELALIENIQRTDLNSIEEALAYRKLIDEFNLSQEETAKRVGKARSSITNALRVLNLPQEIQQALIAGKISEGHAKLISGLDSENKQMALFNKIARNSLSVESAVKEARRMGGTKAARIKINYADKDKEFALREFFSTKVEIKRKGKGGQIIIDFFSDEELEEMIGKVK